VRPSNGSEMLTERTLWIGATTVTIGILVLMIVHPPHRRDQPARLDDNTVYAIYRNCGGAEVFRSVDNSAFMHGREAWRGTRQ
jgi:hypothetical protein